MSKVGRICARRATYPIVANQPPLNHPLPEYSTMKHAMKSTKTLLSLDIVLKVYKPL